MVARKAQKILKDKKQYNARALVKIICDQAVPAAKLGIVGISVPLHLMLDSREEIVSLLTAEGFTVTEAHWCSKTILVVWRPNENS